MNYLAELALIFLAGIGVGTLIASCVPLRRKLPK